MAKLTTQQFAARIREKHPGVYDDMDDDDVTARVIAKMPEYEDMVDVPPAAAARVPTRLLDQSKLTGGEVKRRAAAGERAYQEPGLTRGKQMAGLGLDLVTGLAEGAAGVAGLAADVVSTPFRAAGAAYGAIEGGEGLPGARQAVWDEALSLPSSRKITEFADAGREVVARAGGIENVDTGVPGAALRLVGNVIAPGPEIAVVGRRGAAAARATEGLVDDAARLADDVPISPAVTPEEVALADKAGLAQEAARLDSARPPEPHSSTLTADEVRTGWVDSEMQRGRDALAARELREAGEVPPQGPFGDLPPETPPPAAMDGGAIRPEGMPGAGAVPPSNVGPSGGLPPEPPLDPVQKVLAALRRAKPLRKEQEVIYTATRSERASNALTARQAARDAGLSGADEFDAELSALSGKMDRVDFEPLQVDQGEMTALFRMAADHPDLRLFESVNVRNGLRKMFDGQVPQENQLKMLRQVYGDDLTQELLDKRSTFLKMKEAGLQVANIPRALMSSFDLSAPLRQGVFFVTRPRQFFPAFAKMFKAYGSEDAYKAVEDAVRNSPNFDLMHDSGLAITDLEGLATREEAFATSLAEKMPVAEGSGVLRTPARLAAQGYNATVGKGVRASGRAYTAFLTKLRADVFDDLVSKAKAAGLDVEAPTRSLHARVLPDKKPATLAKDIARFVNAGTGRGEVFDFMKGAQPALNAFFFSPKLMASRLQLMNPLFYSRLDPFVRKEAMKSAAGFVAFGTSLLGLAKAAGADVGVNPFSSDFGKIKVGDTRVDVWGGFQQYVRMFSQLASGKYVSATSGKETLLGEGYKPLTRYDIALRQLESKESPIFSFVTTMLRQQDYAGQPVSAMNEIAERLTPMYAASLYELAKEDPALLPLGAAGMFGVGIQTFKPREKSGPIKSEAASSEFGPTKVGPQSSFGHDEAIDELRQRVPAGSSPEVAVQIAGGSTAVYVGPDGERVPIPAGIRNAFASRFAARDGTETPISRWLTAMMKQKKIKPGGTLSFEA